MRRTIEDRRSPSWLSLTAQAMSETWADGWHDVRTKRSIWLQVPALFGIVAAFTRVVAAVVWSGDSSSPFGSLGRDTQVAARRLRRSPVFAIFSIVSLAIGIGGTTTVYSILRSSVTGPPPGLDHPDALITMREPGYGTMLQLSAGDFDEFRRAQHSFRYAAGWFSTISAITTESRAETSRVELVTGDYFETLGLKPQVGRLLLPSDDLPSASAALVLGDGAWRRLFDADPNVAGQTVLVNGRSFTIVGVAPATFKGLLRNGLIPAAAWTPVAHSPRLNEREASGDRGDDWPLWLVGAFRDGVTLDAAQAETAAIAIQLDRSAPQIDQMAGRGGETIRQTRPRRWLLATIPSLVNFDRTTRTLANVLLASMLLVLMIACTNLANLMLARGADRARDIAVRSALGASRWRLIREAMVEAALIALAGGAASLLVVRGLIVWLTRDIAIHGAGVVRLEPSVDRWVLGMALSATVVALIVVGVVPAWRSSRTNAQATIAGGGHSGALLRWRGRRILIVGQVGISVVLIVLAALSANRLANVADWDVGFDREHLAIVQVDFDRQHFLPGRAKSDADAIVQRLLHLPGVDGSAVTSGLPVGLETMRVNARAENGTSAVTMAANVISATPSLFQTIRLPLISGRALDEKDQEKSAPIAVVSEGLALKLFGIANPIGRTIILGDVSPEARTIVGVASGVPERAPRGTGHGTVYVPLAQHYAGTLAFVVHTQSDPAPSLSRMRAELERVDPLLAVVDSRSGLDLGDSMLLFYEIVAWLTGVLGAFAMLIALAGLYGVLAHLVSKRTREIGLRIALGAARTDVLRLVLGDGLKPVIVGIVAGLAAGAILWRAAQSMFANLLPPMSVMILVIVPLMLLATGIVAAYLPAVRAARVDPNVALRDT